MTDSLPAETILRNANVLHHPALGKDGGVSTYRQETLKSINSAKRRSRELQAEGKTVRRGKP